MSKITKAIIPAAGLGTRVLPATKSMPKEMLPIVDKPAIQYIVEEAAASGITDILVVTNRGKGLIEDHFDRAFEMESNLLKAEKESAYHNIVDISKLANIYFVRQKETKGLGHAVNCGRSFFKGEAFAVLYGDDVVIGDTPATKELIDAYYKYSQGVLGVKKVPADQISKYSSLKLEKIQNERNIFRCTDMIEKPLQDEILSLYSIMGRCILTPEIFDILDSTSTGAGGEIQLTDAMRVLAKTQGMVAVEYSGTRYDMGNKLGIMQAQVETALNHSQIGDDFREYLKSVCKNLK
ncbi:MAG: UTP--glucose-1-phosphate uridylyltransferase [Clostridia bacterium]|nr:UTP--glucose-1-phosphate uridylyltransferase [Clostridia bacterium]